MPTPASSPPDPRPLILTALFEAAVQARFEDLRRTHFPPERNQVPAHLTLFHQLPGSEYQSVRADVGRLGASTSPPVVIVSSVKFTGQGVAYALQSPGLEALRAALADRFAMLLIAQDRQGWRPHVTVQNKVEAAVARQAHATLTAGFTPKTTRIVALALWRYLGGPWEPLDTVAFRGR